MTDAEIICNWMEPKTTEPAGQCEPKALRGSQWWQWSIGAGAFPKPLDLDALHVVEAKLNPAQWAAYSVQMYDCTGKPSGNEIEDLAWHEAIVATRKALLHATAEQKIKAMAAALRSGK